MRKRHFVLAAAVCVGATLSIGASAQAATAGLGQFQLGMTIEEAKAVPIVPLSENKADAGLRCTGEENGTSATTVSPAEQAEGVVECVVTARFNTEYLKSSSYYREALKFGAIILDPLFRFRDGRLFAIDLYPHMNWQQQLDDALVLKYGKPTSIDISTVQNAYGAEWPKVSQRWTMGSQQITLDAPGSSRDEMYFFIRDTVVSEELDAAVRARKAAATGI